MAILIASLSLLFFVFSLGQFARIDIIPGIAITGLDIAVASFIVFWCIRLIAKKEFILSPVWKSYTIFIGLAVFSLLLNAFFIPQLQVIAALLYLVRFVCYGTLFFIIFSLGDKEKKIVVFSMLLSGLLAVGVGYLQYFYYPALRNLYYAGWDEHFYRMFGTFLDPNFLGLFFVLYTLFLLSLFFSYNSIKIKIGIFVIFLLTVGAIFLTYSRSSLIALLVGCTTFLLMNGSKKLAFILIFLIVIGGAITFLFTGKRSEGTNFFRIISSQARIGNMKDALTVWHDNPVFGVGFNAYRYAQHRHGIYLAGWEEGHGSAGADNSFLFVLATTGLVGLSAFLYFLFQHIHFLRKQKNILKMSLGIATLISLSVGSFFINGFFYPSLMVWLWIILGITESR